MRYVKIKTGNAVNRRRLQKQKTQRACQDSDDFHGILSCIKNLPERRRNGSVVSFDGRRLVSDSCRLKNLQVISCNHGCNPQSTRSRVVSMLSTEENVLLHQTFQFIAFAKGKIPSFNIELQHESHKEKSIAQFSFSLIRSEQ